MQISYDTDKNKRNITERGLSFDLVSNLDWSNARIIEDTRKDYGECRFRVFAYLEERLMVLVLRNAIKLSM
ncbi:BrnT family toxin [Glaciimonas sp. GG7]